MADILIRRVRFPENCAQCFNAHNEYCYLLNRRLVTKDWVQRKDDCPLVELPEHGDLISKDDAMNAILGEPPEAHYPSWYASIVNEIPAIVPSNKEETE